MIRSQSTRTTLVGVAVYVAMMGALLSVSASSCAHPPPTASPAATQAFYKTRVIKALDLVRDIAQDGAAQPNPPISIVSAKVITAWHQSALRIIGASDGGWQPAVLTSLDEVFTHLTPDEQHQLGAYFALAKTLLAEVHS